MLTETRYTWDRKVAYCPVTALAKRQAKGGENAEPIKTILSVNLLLNFTASSGTLRCYQSLAANVNRYISPTNKYLQIVLSFLRHILRFAYVNKLKPAISAHLTIHMFYDRTQRLSALLVSNILKCDLWTQTHAPYTEFETVYDLSTWFPAQYNPNTSEYNPRVSQAPTNIIQDSRCAEHTPALRNLVGNQYKSRRSVFSSNLVELGYVTSLSKWPKNCAIKQWRHYPALSPNCYTESEGGVMGMNYCI